MSSRKRSLSDKAPRRKSAHPHQEAKAVRRRILLVGGCFVAVYLMLLGRAFYLQVWTAEEWQKRASSQHTKTISLTPQRGAIYDRNGGPLAISLEADSVYVNPTEAKTLLKEQRERLEKNPDPDETVESYDTIAEKLGAILSITPVTIRQKLERDKKFIWIKRRISAKESRLLETVDLPGVHTIKEHVRSYPQGRVAGQVLGFSGADNEGLEGIERRYNGLVAGDGSYLTIQADGGRRGIGSSEQIFKGRQGKDLYLTIDTQLQFIVEKELLAAVKEAEARAGSAVMMDPFSGEILAMASVPDYDPNRFRHSKAFQRRNRVVCDTYEPGSTFKLFLLAAALDTGLISTKETIDCGHGSYKVGGKIIHDHRPMGRLTVNDVLKYSSNIGCAKIAQHLGKDTFYTYLRAFGFGDKTGIDFDGEGSGILRPPQRWFEIDLAAISFGQGLTATALQLVTATSALVNGGELMRPYLVRRIQDERNEVTEERHPTVVRRVVSRDVSLALRKMMMSVTEPDGTGSRAQVPGFEVGGKTGTAQKVDPVTGTYSVDKRVSSFIGFAPAKDPQIVVLVTLDEPQGKAYGGLLAAPVFSRIVEQALRYLHVPTTQPVVGNEATVQAEVPIEVPHVPVFLSEQVDREVGVKAMPDCRGLTARQILELMENSGLNIKIIGEGRVVSQSPPPGAAITAKGATWVHLQSPEQEGGQ
nr:penicillin-binding protein [uncultured Desulfuromonas sp.]